MSGSVLQWTCTETPPPKNVQEGIALSGRMSLRNAQVTSFAPREERSVTDTITITDSFKVTAHNGGVLGIVAPNDQTKNYWMRIVNRRIDLLNQQQLMLDPDPNIYTPALASVDRLAGSKTVASQAVQCFERWQRSLDHTEIIERTENTLANIQDLIGRVEANHDPTFYTDSKATVDSLVQFSNDLLQCVRDERAVREIRPIESLRAFLWGVGPHFPMLSSRAVGFMSLSFSASIR